MKSSYKHINRSRLIAQILSLLQHGDELLLREIGEHVGLSRYTVSNVINNHKQLFIARRSENNGPGCGRGIKRVYSLSELGKERHKTRHFSPKEEATAPFVRFPIKIANPLLVLLYCKVWGPIRLSNASRQLAEEP